MKYKVSFEVPGEPKGKGRPRFSTKTGRAFTPQDTLNYENLVKFQYKMKAIDQYTENPIKATIICYYSIPKSFSKKKRELALCGFLRPTKKPDADNCGKAILDALNGIAYQDDRQVVILIVEKYYGEKPFVKVDLEEL